MSDVRCRTSDNAIVSYRSRIVNYDSEDVSAITEAILSLRPDSKGAHVLAWGVADIAKEHHDPALGKVLRWGYENTPCGNCRWRCLVQLDAIGQLKGTLLRECQYDSDEEIRQLAEKRLAVTSALDNEVQNARVRQVGRRA